LARFAVSAAQKPFLCKILCTSSKRGARNWPPRLIIERGSPLASFKIEKINTITPKAMLAEKCGKLRTFCGLPNKIPSAKNYLFLKLASGLLPHL
jgi:hypothetical protein